MRFFIRFAKTYERLQIIELKSLLQQKGECTKIEMLGKDGLYCIIEVDSISTIDFILERAIFVKSVSFSDYLHFDDFVKHFNINKDKISIRLKITTIDTHMNIEQRNQILQKNMIYIGDYKINLSNPDYIYQIFVSGKEVHNTILYKNSRRKYFLRYDIKERPFIGITCMDWEISILMANLCGLDSSSLVLEPYIGSGGIAMACLLFDAKIIGIEYDLKMLYGQKERNGNVKTSMKGYKIYNNFEMIDKAENVISIINADSFTINLDCQFVAIITDPPYGDRISLGKRHSTEYIRCLKRLADKNLRKGGKVCFFFPTEYDAVTKEIFDGLILLVEEEQKLRSVTRTLYVYQK